MKPSINSGILKEFSWVLVGNVFNTIGLLIVTKILSANLSQTSYGLYYIGTTLSILAIQIFFGPLGNGFSRFYWVADEKNELSIFFHQSLTICRYITLLFFTISTLLYFYGKDKYNINLSFFAIFTILAITSSYSSLIYSYFNILRLRSIVAVYQIIEAITKVVSLIFVAYFLNNSLINFLYFLTGISIITLLVQTFHLKNFGIFNGGSFFKLTGSWTYSILNFSFPFVIWGVFTWFQMSSDRYFLGFFLSPAKVAEYAIVFQLGYYPPSILIGNFVQTITPILYQKIGANKSSENLKSSTSLINKMTLYACVLVLIGFIFALAFSDIIIKLLAHDKYLSSSYLLPFMFLSGGIFSTAQILCIDYQSKLRMNELMKIKILTSIVGIVASFFFIKHYGLEGAIFSSILFSVSYLLVLWVFSRNAL
jgi:O-antigen/teichoic acid export membrane protein